MIGRQVTLNELNSSLLNPLSESYFCGDFESETLYLCTRTSHSFSKLCPLCVAFVREAFQFMSELIKRIIHFICLSKSFKSLERT